MKKITRRDFLFCSGAFLSSATPASALWPGRKDGHPISIPADIKGTILKNDAPKEIWKWSCEGFLYKKLSNLKVVCGICPNKCILSPGDRSVCRSKVNFNGVLHSLTYGNPCAVHVDPVEKKPLFHFMTGSKTFSLATTGCNFRCLNCQNWEISQSRPEDIHHTELFPVEAVSSAIQSKSASIAYTYSEPTTFFEYMIDTARLAHENDLYNLWVSNGYINKTPLLELCKVLDGANINIKSYSDSMYRKLNGGRLSPVLNTFKILHQENIHFEMTNLVVPGFVDDKEMVKKMCDWILNNLGPGHPLHFLRFFPKYKLDRLAPTPISVLDQFRNLAMEAGIRYVYIGNVPGHPGNNTYCHNCKKLLIERRGFTVPVYNLINNKCKFCQSDIPGVWHDNTQE